ncbi:MAG: translocation/assembly module TamB domain-containing protein [Runella sp.]
MQRAFRYIVNTIFIILISAVLLIGAFTLAMQSPMLQTALVSRLTHWLSEKIQHSTSIGKVNIKWFDAISLENVKILDRAGRPMIQVERLDLNHDFWALLLGKDKKTFGTSLNAATLYRPSVWLVKDPKTGDLNLDDLIARIELLTANPHADTTLKDQNVPFVIQNVRLVEGEFRWDDPRELHMKGKAFDYNHFKLKNINGTAQNFMVLGDTIALNIKNLRTFDERTNLNIKRLDTRLLYCRTKLELADLHAQIGNSTIGNYLSFNYDTPAAFGDFNSRVRMKAFFDDTRVRSEDLGWFADYLFTLNETWTLKGFFDGTVDDFRLVEADIRFGQNSRIRGNAAFKGVRNFGTAQLRFDLKDTRIATTDLQQYYPEKSFNEWVQKLGTIDFSTRYEGTIERFKLNGDFKTSIGQVKVAQLEMNLSAKLPTYSADVQAQDFDLGYLLNDKSLSKMDLNGRIKGKGFSVKEATLNFDGRLPRFSYNNYMYRNVYLKGLLQNKFFEGNVSVRDTNLTMYLDGIFDFSGKRNSYFAKGRVENANLRALNFLKDSLSIQTDLDVNLDGNSLDEIVGEAQFLNTYLTLNKRSLLIDTLLIDSRLSEQSRSLEIISEFFNFKAEGSFNPTVALKDISRLFEEYEMYFVGDEATRTAYYEKKQTNQTANVRYDVNYKIGFKKMGRLLAFLYPQGEISEGASAEGVFRIGNVSMFSLNAYADTLRIGNNTFYQSDIDLNTSKFTHSPEVLASAIVNSQKQQLVGIAPTEKLSLEAAWDKDHIDFRSNLRQRQTTNRANLNGELRFVGDYMYLQFKRSSRLRLLEEEWNFDANNLITIIGPEVTFSNIVLKTKDQLLALNGNLSTDSLRALTFETRNFQLATLNPVLNTNIGGVANGGMILRNVYRNAIIDTKLNVQKLTYNNFLMGNLAGEGEWDPIDQHLHIDIHLDRNAQQTLALKGTYTPDLKDNELDLIADFNETDLSLLEPFARGLVSDLSGKAVGKVTIKGSPTSPLLDGVVEVKRGKLTFDYLKAVFAFEDRIYFGESDIRVKNLRLTDPEGNTAILRGGVYHDSFQKFSIGFDANMRNFKILNTTLRDNELFYGTAYATGKMEVFGPINNLKIEADLTSNRNTKIYIPLDGAAEVASEEFVQFVNPKADTTTQNVVAEAKIIPPQENIIKMDLRLNITPDAYCEIQFDRQSGDAIRAYGRGLINLKIDTRGDFDMAGSYEIQNGDYLFTLQNIINKKFQIQKGSRISWTGDPYGAILDVKAGYTANTLLSPLSQVGTSTQATRDEWYTRRYPVEVILSLSDKMLAPQIGYELKFKEYPANRQYEINAAEARLKRDEQYLAQQVSGMLLFGQLLSDQNDFLAQSGAAGFNTVSELVTSQLSKWLSSLNENLEVGLTGFNFNDPNALNNLQLRFSYRFFNDRFRITRDGRLSYGQNQYDATNLLLDWTLEYWLTDDGSQRVRMYNRNIQNQFSAMVGMPNTVSYGASYLFTRSFDRFRNLGPKQSRPEVVPKTDSGRLTTMKN